MSYARKYDQFRERRCEVMGICVDSPEQNRAMIDKLLPPFKLLSDPEGDDVIKAYGLWDAEGRIAVPAIVAAGRDGRIRYAYTGRDFADRPGDEELLRAVDDGATGG